MQGNKTPQREAAPIERNAVLRPAIRPRRQGKTLAVIVYSYDTILFNYVCQVVYHKK